MPRVNCPNCDTSYTLERLGITLPEDTTSVVHLTVACMVCKRQFDATIGSETINRQEISKPKTWTQWALRRPADIQVVEVIGWTTKSKMRKE